MSVDETTSGDAVAERTPGHALMAGLVTVLVLDAIDMVFLQTEEGTINGVVEIFFPGIAAIGLARDTQVNAVLRQHLHISVSILEGEILTQAGVDFPNVAGVVPKGGLVL